MLREMFTVDLFSSDDEAAVTSGADESEYFDEMTPARARAVSLVRDGHYARAIVSDDNLDDVYDTLYDAALNSHSQPLLAVVPIGPRQRVSSLAERVLV
jgi:hypothetical protein